jgi:hypothetical protein
MSDTNHKLTEAMRLTVFFGKKYKGKTLGEVAQIREGKHPRGLLWISWVANLNAVNGPQPRDERIAFHRACQTIAEHFDREISEGIEAMDAESRQRRVPRHHYTKQKKPETFEV